MREVDLQQGTHAWNAWRNNKICGTDSSVIMGMNPFGKTPLKLWQEKISQKSSFKPSYASERGKALEPVAREWFIRTMGVEIIPAVIESVEYPWAGASLDGLSKDRSAIVEIKCPLPENCFEAIKNEIPLHYFAQCQHQMFVAGLKEVWYVIFDGEKGHTREIKRDEEFIKRMFHAEQEFWDRLQNLEPPEETQNDYDIIGDADTAQLMTEYFRLNDQIKEMEGRQASIKLDLLEAANDKNIICGLGKMTKVFRKGAIQYKDIPILYGMDLEPYRKKPSEYYLIKEI